MINKPTHPAVAIAMNVNNIVVPMTRTSGASTIGGLSFDGYWLSIWARCRRPE